MKRINVELSPPTDHISEQIYHHSEILGRITRPNYWRKLGYKVEMIHPDTWIRNTLRALSHPMTPVHIEDARNLPFDNHAILEIVYTPPGSTMYLKVTHKTKQMDANGTYHYYSAREYAMQVTGNQ